MWTPPRTNQTIQGAPDSPSKLTRFFLSLQALIHLRQRTQKRPKLSQFSKGLTAAHRLGLDRVLLLTDCQRLVRAFQDCSDDLSWGALTLVPDLRASAAIFQDFCLDFVPRACNMEAHYLAARGATSPAIFCYKISKDWGVIVWLRHLCTQTQITLRTQCASTQTDGMNLQSLKRTSVWRRLKDLPRKQSCSASTCDLLPLFGHGLYKWKLINPDAKMVYLPHPKPVVGVEITFSAL
ncbi:hypothetical protein GIB67_033013 [Kingdonia uniflora]|uniref:RNase H type-1 domain-containing protein n=1 Tax=Kingdonia uniflora TaxID=39325 RepID=A0A7J7MY94_9MAGN|nr:hypothetical protein GIB67_033013 [Kingdonia uniflora]